MTTVGNSNINTTVVPQVPTKRKGSPWVVAQFRGEITIYHINSLRLVTFPTPKQYNRNRSIG